MVQFLPLEIMRGDTYAVPLVVRDEYGNVLNLTGASLKLTAKKALSDADATAVFQLTTLPSGGIVITDAAIGLVTPTFQPANTSGLSAGTWVLRWDLQVTKADGSIFTAYYGPLTVVPDVTTM